MVRLGVSISELLGLSRFGFQFQYGSIGSTSGDGIRCSERIVSIPVWFDWERLFFDCLAWLRQVFQFQYGSIGSNMIELDLQTS